MEDHNGLAERFEENRTHLRAVAYRMLGSLSEADDAVQESWLRLSRSGGSGVDNLGGWLTTVVARVSLDMLRARKSHREEPLGAHLDDSIVSRADVTDPEHEALLAESVGPALLVILETLAPAERLAFVLHDLFAVPFDEIAPIVGRSPAAARQLASRARRRVQGAATVPDAALTRQREIVDAFLAASREGDFNALLTLLDPDVVLRADGAVVRAGALEEVRGAAAVARTFAGRARAAQLALVNGAPGAVWAPGGQPRVVFDFTIEGRKVVEIEMLADAEKLGQLDLELIGRVPERPARRTSSIAAEYGEERAMGILTDDMKRIVKEQKLGFIATICPDGTPNLSPKGTMEVWDDDHLIFVDIRSPGTIANLRQNPAIEINMVDQLVRKGYRFKGTAQVLTEGPEFDKVLGARQERGAPNPMRALVLMTVERALPLTSPAYDLGVSEDELRARYRRIWQELWDGAYDSGGAAMDA